MELKIWEMETCVLATSKIKSVDLTDHVVTLCFASIPVIASSLCAEFVFTSHCMCMHSFYPVEQLVFEHVISMATTSKTDIKYNLL